MSTIIRAAVAGVAAVATLAALAACAPAADEGGPTSLTIGIDSTTFSTSQTPLDGLNLLYWAGTASYESLFGWDPFENDFIPWLAEDWEIRDDRLSMSIKLREDVDFIDGVHMDAQAVADFIALALESDNIFFSAVAVDYGMTTVATGEYTLEVTTTKAINNVFLGNIRDLGIASPVAAADREGLKTQAAGTGPYLVDEVVPDSSISYVRNPDYWNPEAFEFDELEYVFFSDKVAAANALRSGQVDATTTDATVATDLEEGGFTIVEGGGAYHTLLVTDFTGEIQPALADVRVRHAMSMAIDGAAIIESIEHGYGFLNDQGFAKGQDEYVEGAEDTYPYDVEAARELMAEAGYAGGFDIEVPRSSGSAIYPVAYELIVQQSLAEIGVRITYVSVTGDAGLFEAWQSGDYPVMLVSANYENTLGIIIGDQPLFGHFRDDAEWAALQDVVDHGTIEEAAAASKAIGEYMLDQAWYVPIVHYAIMWAVVPEVELTLSRYSEIFGLYRFKIAEGQ